MTEKTRPSEQGYVYTPWITKNGKRIYAKQFGWRAFKIKVDK